MKWLWLNKTCANVHRYSFYHIYFHPLAPSTPLGGTQRAVYPIASLTPYQNKWCIKARVTNKSDIRRWSNSRGEGHLFSMDLVDESGEIRATAFKAECDKFEPIAEIDKVRN